MASISVSVAPAAHSAVTTAASCSLRWPRCAGVWILSSVASDSGHCARSGAAMCPEGPRSPNSTFTAARLRFDRRAASRMARSFSGMGAMGVGRVRSPVPICNGCQCGPAMAQPALDHRCRARQPLRALAGIVAIFSAASVIPKMGAAALADAASVSSSLSGMSAAPP